LRKKDSSFSLSSEKSRKERKPKATRIIILLHQFNGSYNSLSVVLRRGNLSGEYTGARSGRAEGGIGLWPVQGSEQ
jgi:hypothetical protein